MKRMQWLFVAVLATTLVLGGCGKQGAPTVTGPAGHKTEAIDNDLGMLVPQDAVALVYLANAAAFETKLKGLVSEIDAGAVNEIDFDKMGAKLLPGASQFWDRTRPCAIAVSLPPGDGDPMEAIGSGQGIVLIFPMTDIEAARTGMEAQLAGAPADRRPAMKIRGSYLAFSGAPGVAWGDSVPALAESAPAGDLALRIDLGALVTKFRKQIDEGLGGIEEMMGAGLEAAPPQDAAALQGVLTSMTGWVKDFVDSAEMFELGAQINGAVADLRVGFTAKAGSKLDIEHADHGDLAAVAAHLPEGFPLHLLLRLDYGKMMKWLEPIMASGFASMPEDSRAKWQAYMKEAMDMSKLLGPNFAVAFGVTDSGLQLVEIMDVKNAALYMERTEKLMALAGDVPGLSFQKAEPTMVAGVEVSSWDMQIDIEKLMDPDLGGLPPDATEIIDKVMNRVFGGESIRFHMATVGGKLLLTMGDMANLESVIKSISTGKGKTPSALLDAIKKAGGRPAFLLQLDLRALLSQVLGLVTEIAREIDEDEKIPSVPAGAPIPVVVWGSHEGRRYGGGLSVDVGGIVDLVNALKK